MLALLSFLDHQKVPFPLGEGTSTSLPDLIVFADTHLTQGSLSCWVVSRGPASGMQRRLKLISVSWGSSPSPGLPRLALSP